MNLRQAWIADAIILAGMVVVTVGAWPLFPAGQMIPVHFTFDGTPNKFAPAETGLLILPVLALLLSVAMNSRAARNNFGGFVPLAQRPLSPAWVVILAVLAAGQMLIIGYALHPATDVLRLFFVALGGLLAVLGATMSDVRPNAAIGIRTPWTRADVKIWQATHRFGSIVFVIAGILLAATAAFSQETSSLIVIALLDIVLAAVVCAAYSYALSKADATRNAGSGHRSEKVAERG